MAELLKTQEEIGKYIKFLREKREMSARELADELNVSPPLVSNWENGTKAPGYLNYIMLAGVFGVEIDDIFSANKLIKTSNINTLEDYLESRNHKNILSKLETEQQTNIILDLLNSIRDYKNLLNEYLKGNEIDDYEYNRLYNLLFPWVRTISHVMIVFSEDKGFDYNNILKKTYLPNSSPVENDEIYDKVLALNPNSFFDNCPKVYVKENNDVLSPHLLLIDNLGREARIRYFSFDTSLEYSNLDTFRFFIECCFNNITSDAIMELVIFEPQDIITSISIYNDFTKYFISKYNSEYLDLYLPLISKAERSKLLLYYIKENEYVSSNTLHKFLYYDAVISNGYGFMNLTFDYETTCGLMKYVLDALYNHKEIISSEELRDILAI